MDRPLFIYYLMFLFIIFIVNYSQTDPQKLDRPPRYSRARKKKSSTSSMKAQHDVCTLLKQIFNGHRDPRKKKENKFTHRDKCDYNNSKNKSNCTKLLLIICFGIFSAWGFGKVRDEKKNLEYSTFFFSFPKSLEMPGKLLSRVIDHRLTTSPPHVHPSPPPQSLTEHTSSKNQ